LSYENIITTCFSDEFNTRTVILNTRLSSKRVIAHILKQQQPVYLLTTNENFSHGD